MMNDSSDEDEKNGEDEEFKEGEEIMARAGDS